MTENTINNDMTMGGATATLLAGRYRVVRRLGQGGMGAVWLAEDTKLDGFKVAIKMLPSVLVNNKRAYAQVKAEALVSLKLSHPNIATVRAFEEESGSPFLVMDYIDGQTLDDYLAEKGKLTEDETVKLLKPVAAALDYAHGQGVVHRDVKPGNVMIRKDGTPFVLDFGIAREIQETMTRVTGKLSSGTLMYMSPEQLHGAAPKPSQDIYSFAAMAYECLKGEPPFSRGQIEYQIEHDAPANLGPQFIKCGPGVMAGLAKSPDVRPVSCMAVLGKDKESAVNTDSGAFSSLSLPKIISGSIILVLLGVSCSWLCMENSTYKIEMKDGIQSEGREHLSGGMEMADKKRQEDLLRLTTLRTRITIKIAAAKSDYDKVAAYRNEKDGFEQHLMLVDSQWLKIEKIGYSKSIPEAEKTLAELTDAADAIAYELNWLASNREGRDAAKRIATEISEELDDKLRVLKVDDVAKSLYDKGMCERKDAAAAFSRGEFVSACRLYESSRSTLDSAILAARKFHVDTAIRVAAEFERAELWQKCVDAAKGALKWDATNVAAKALVMNAQKHLAPTAGSVRVFKFPGDVEMEMVYCTAGEFEMGDDNGQIDEIPARKVRLTKDFWIGKYQVTQAQWKKMMSAVGPIAEMDENPSYFCSDGEGRSVTVDMDTSDFPVEQVSWQDCQRLIAALNKKLIGEFVVSLPTEAQWEFAARGGTKSRGYVYSGGNELQKVGWFCDNSGIVRPTGGGCANIIKEKDCALRTHAVNEEISGNEISIIGMSGNTWEWCEDRYDKDYYAIAPCVDPVNQQGSGDCVVRGGSYRMNATCCRVTERFHAKPNERHRSWGVRFVCSNVAAHIFANCTSDHSK